MELLMVVHDIVIDKFTVYPEKICVPGYLQWLRSGLIDKQLGIADNKHELVFYIDKVPSNMNRKGK